MAMATAGERYDVYLMEDTEEREGDNESAAIFIKRLLNKFRIHPLNDVNPAIDVCLPRMHFVPGYSLIDCHCEAVAKSNKVLCTITPSNSNWIRFCHQSGFYDKICKGEKHCVIVVFVGFLNDADAIAACPDEFVSKTNIFFSPDLRGNESNWDKLAMSLGLHQRLFPECSEAHHPSSQMSSLSDLGLTNPSHVYIRGTSANSLGQSVSIDGPVGEDEASSSTNLSQSSIVSSTSHYKTQPKELDQRVHLPIADNVSSVTDRWTGLNQSVQSEGTVQTRDVPYSEPQPLSVSGSGGLLCNQRVGESPMLGGLSTVAQSLDSNVSMDNGGEAHPIETPSLEQLSFESGSRYNHQNNLVPLDSSVETSMSENNSQIVVDPQLVQRDPLANFVSSLWEKIQYL